MRSQQAESGDATSSARGALRASWDRTSGVLRRGWGHAGPDRDALLLIVKSMVAASAAWLIANDLLGAPSATFAPFTALLMVQATISQSVFQALRYAAAMLFGVVLAGSLTPLMGPLLVTFAVLIVIALLIGRWRRLGTQGPQVGVAAMFAYSAFVESGQGESSFAQIGSIAGLVILGCSLGVLTNLIIVPPMRYRSAEYGISSLSQSLCDLLTDMSDGLSAGIPDGQNADSWRHRANQFPDTVAQARATMEEAAETFRFNPRRLFMRSSTSFEGHRVVLNALERASEQLRSISHGLTDATGENTPHHREHDQFFEIYSGLLSAVAEAARVLGNLHSAQDVKQANEFDEATDRARRAYQRLTEHSAGEELDSPEQWPIYGALQTDAHRAVEEFLQARNNLTPLMEPSPEHPTSEEAENINEQAATEDEPASDATRQQGPTSV